MKVCTDVIGPYNVFFVCDPVWRTKLQKLFWMFYKTNDDMDETVFPGSNPSSVMEQDLECLREPYVVAEKTDGVRYFMLFCFFEERRYCLLANRRFDIYVAPIVANDTSLYHGTLVDVELVRVQGSKCYQSPQSVDETSDQRGNDQLNCDIPTGTHSDQYLQTIQITDSKTMEPAESGKFEQSTRFAQSGDKMTPLQILRNRCVDDTIKNPGEHAITDTHDEWCFLLFDLYHYSGISLQSASYVDRHAMCHNVVRQSGDRHLRVKPIFAPQQWHELDAHLSRLDHASDGLIFTPHKCELLTGRHKLLFKWKRQCDNTVDCVLRIADPEYVRSNLHRLERCRYALCCQNKGKLCVWQYTEGPVTWIDQYIRNADRANGEIVVECHFDGTAWTVRQERSDKSDPNTLFVAERTRQNIEENIGVERLRQFFGVPRAPAPASHCRFEDDVYVCDES